MGLENAQGPSTTHLYLVNIEAVGHGLAVGRMGKSIMGFSLKLFWGRCHVGMTYHLKEGKMS